MTLRLTLATFFCIAVVIAIVLWPVGVPQDRFISNFEIRADAEAAEKPELELVILGTSLTAKYSWPEQLAETLQTCLSQPVVLENVSVAGANSSQAYEMAEQIATENPDLILIEFAINDADFLDGVSRSVSLTNHSELIFMLQQNYPEARLMLITTNPLSGLAILKRPRLGAYYLQYRDLAEIHDIGLADIYPRWLEIPLSQRRHPDGVHPDDAQMTEMMVPPLTGLIKASRGNSEPCVS
ncbi:MAG: SGNH/GDSL hydrolase family protein [Arenibacterium sp.]